MPLSTYLNLGLGKLAHTRLTVELADRTVKYPKGIVLKTYCMKLANGERRYGASELGSLDLSWAEDLDTGIDDYPSYCDDKKIQ
ncbi:hypothetical protein Tco_0289767 [Tanacetum coccineum]